MNGAVHMTFRREIDDRVRQVRGQGFAYRFGVSDVGMDKRVAGFSVNIRYGLQIGGIARIGELVVINNHAIRNMLEDMPDEVAADETTAAGN